MARRSKRLQLPTSIPEGLRRLLRASPYSQGDSQRDYALLLQDLVDALQPRDSIEMLWINDVVTYSLEAQHLRRIHAELLHPKPERPIPSPDPRSLEEMTESFEPFRGMPIWDYDEAKFSETDEHGGIERILPSDSLREAERKYRATLDFYKDKRERETSPKRRGAPREGHSSLTKNFLEYGPELERLNRMIAQADARRDAALRSIERHRSASGSTLRDAPDKIVDAEFTETKRQSKR